MAGGGGLGGQETGGRAGAAPAARLPVLVTVWWVAVLASLGLAWVDAKISHGLFTASGSRTLGWAVVEILSALVVAGAAALTWRLSGVISAGLDGWANRLAGGPDEGASA